MSSFKRVGRGAKTAPLSGSKAPLLNSLRGVKPWTGGIYLTSVGVNDLDNLLGGGQPLGTCILLQEDRWTRDLASSLLKYWCAEVCITLLSVFDFDFFAVHLTDHLLHSSGYIAGSPSYYSGRGGTESGFSLTI
jgi:hypothetical protein